MLTTPEVDDPFETEVRRAGSFEGPGIEEWLERAEGGRIEEGCESVVEIEVRDLAVELDVGAVGWKPKRLLELSFGAIDDREGCRRGLCQPQNAR